MSDYQTLSVTRDGAVATVSFNRPDSLNAFNDTMRRELVHAAAEVNGDDSVRVVVLAGNGRAFSAGADLTDFSFDGAGDATPGEITEQMLNDEYKPGVLAISDAPKPWISAVNGAAAGIGSAFAMVCDLTVMAEDAYLYQAFSAIGLVPDGGATWQLQQVVGRKRAYELMVSGEKLGAEKCLALGLCNRVVPTEDLLAQTQAWAQELATKAPLALRHAKRSLNLATEQNLGDTISSEASLQKLCVDSADAMEGIGAFLEKRAPQWQGK